MLSDVVIAKNYLSEEKHFMDNTIEIDVEMLNRNDWEKAIITKINEIPFDYIGKGEQIFITTHSSFVANKLGIENLELLNKKLLTKFENLTEDISW